MIFNSGMISVWLHPIANSLMDKELKDTLCMTFENCCLGTMKGIDWVSFTYQFYGGLGVHLFTIFSTEIVSEYVQLY